MPLWIYTAGAKILGESVDILLFVVFLQLIFLLVVHTLVGMLIKRKKPTVAQNIVKYLRPVTLMVLLLLVAVGFYVFLYILKLLPQADWQLVVTCAALPAGTTTICAMTAFLLQPPWKQIKIICFEVVVQNIAVPLLVLNASMEQPDADLSSAPSVLVAISVGLYLGIAGIIHVLHKKCCKSNLKTR